MSDNVVLQERKPHQSSLSHKWPSGHNDMRQSKGNLLSTRKDKHYSLLLFHKLIKETSCSFSLPWKHGKELLRHEIKVTDSMVWVSHHHPTNCRAVMPKSKTLPSHIVYFSEVTAFVLLSLTNKKCIVWEQLPCVLDLFLWPHSALNSILILHVGESAPLIFEHSRSKSLLKTC